MFFKSPPFFVFVQILAFIITFTSLLTVEVDQMGAGDFWVNKVLPIPYWFGLLFIVVIAVLMIPNIEDKRFRWCFIFSSLLLLVSIRMAFPTIFTSITAYEPDTTRYMAVINAWTNQGLHFGDPGLYQHDYPLSFLLGYSMVKLGLSIDLFFRLAPFVVYIINALLIYLIVKVITQNRVKIAALSVFIFSISSLSAWVSIHYCPDLIGSLFFLLSLYLTLKFSFSKKWTIQSVTIIIISTLLLLLSHHLSTLYFIVTMFGLSLSTHFFKKNSLCKSTDFLLIGIFTYTFWFAYGNLMYPDFFKLANYFISYGGYTTQIAQGAPPLILFQYLTYPVFVTLFSLFGAFQFLNIRNFDSLINQLRAFKNPFYKLIRLREKIVDGLILYNFGNIFNFGVFILGFLLTVIFNDRVLEVIFIGLYPLTSITILRLIGFRPSKKKLFLLIVFFILIVLIDTTRYYSAMQRRILLT